MGYGAAAQAQMLRLLDLFDDAPADAATHATVRELIADFGRWPEAHALFRNVRQLTIAADEQKARPTRLHCELLEACLKTVYNEANVGPPFSASVPPPFDSISPLWVVPAALHLAEELAIPLSAVRNCLTSSQHHGL